MPDYGRAARCLSPGRGVLDRFAGHRLTADAPLATSEILTQVTPRIFSPSIDAIASANFSMI
jgi:hypothetical protein